MHRPFATMKLCTENAKGADNRHAKNVRQHNDDMEGINGLLFKCSETLHTTTWKIYAFKLLYTQHKR